MGAREKVAEAICGVTGAGQMFPWQTLSEREKDAWRARADAAIQALGLTEEWGVRRGQGVFQFHTDGFPTEQAAQASADRINKRYWKENENVAGAAIAAPEAHPVSRLVTPWEARS